MIKQSIHTVKGSEIRVWHPNKDAEGYSISSASGGWMCGLYETLESALLGASYDMECNEDFYEMQERVNSVYKENRLITIKDIMELS
jgi:hypothetical protein